MSFWSVSWCLLKMLYQLLWCSVSLCSFLFNVFWFLCTLASAGIPWFTLLLLFVCIASKFVKLQRPTEKHLRSLLGVSSEDVVSWPIAHRGAGYDAPENSRAALYKCAARGCRHVLLDLGLTACGELVLVNRLTLERAGLKGGVSRHTLQGLRSLDTNALHPLGAQYGAEQVMTLPELLRCLTETPELQSLTPFLYVSEANTPILEALRGFLKDATSTFVQRTILVSRSPYLLYQLRKQEPALVCGLWTERTVTLGWLKASSLCASIYGAICRHIVAPVIGVSLVFVNKEEFNLHVAELWRNVGVRPIVYNVNSPNEKRYFQKTMKTQYLTDSLRSEPQLLMKA